jgi:hypothetical protein
MINSQCRTCLASRRIRLGRGQGFERLAHVPLDFDQGFQDGETLLATGGQHARQNRMGLSAALRAIAAPVLRVMTAGRNMRSA